MENIERFNPMEGVIYRTNNFGCFVIDEATGLSVFYYGPGEVGDRVKLSVSKIDRERNRITCCFESVVEYGDFSRYDEYNYVAPEREEISLFELERAA